MTTLTTFTTLSDADLLAEVTRIATCERHATAQFVASLAELDARRLYLGRGFSSMFTYCIQALHLSEHAAYNPHRSRPNREAVPHDPSIVSQTGRSLSRRSACSRPI
jgi:hypothetical protein